MARGTQHRKRTAAGRQGPPRPAPPPSGGIAPAEQRIVVIAAVAALIAFLLAVLARSEVVPETAGAIAALAIGSAVSVASVTVWLRGGDYRDRERIPVIAPVALAGAAIAAAVGVLLGGGAGILLSVMVALASSAVFGIALGGRRGPRPPAA